MRRATACAAAFAAAAVAAVAPATALAPPSAWNGANPFNCTLQQAGLGATVPDPAADPYCVDFDKRHQNLTQLGIVDFLSKEPARVAAAVPKCFYFQSDHWVAAVVQGDGQTELYRWDGHYFFDKATGDGGAWVTNFAINGHTADPSAIPGIPQQYAQFLGPGTGGAITHDSIPADPGCVAKARRGGVYATAPRARCAPASGGVGRGHLGPVGLGEAEDAVQRRLGPPRALERGFLRYCLADGSALLAGEAGDRSGDPSPPSGEPLELLLTTSPALRLAGIGPGSSAAAVARAFPRRVGLARYDGLRVLAAGPRSPFLVGLRGRRVRFIALYRRAAISRSALGGWLRRTR